jgi:hypothetical protein
MKNIAGASGGGEDKRLKKNIEFLNIFSKDYNNSRHFKAVFHKSKPSGVIEIIVVIKTVVACVIRWVNVNQFYFSSKVAFKGV